MIRTISATIIIRLDVSIISVRFLAGGLQCIIYVRAEKCPAIIIIQDVQSAIYYFIEICIYGKIKRWHEYRKGHQGMLHLLKRNNAQSGRSGQNQEEEKKVEYIELIYDLIFVYLIGRNNSLLTHIQYGFISGRVFLTYVLVTLTIIQIWSFTTFYINRHGRKSLREHVFLFVNMYLLYYMADGTRVYWQSHFDRYNTAWALILFNIGLQYFLESRSHTVTPWNLAQIRRNCFIIWGEMLIVIISIPAWHLRGLILSPAAIAFGMFAMLLSGKVNRLVPVDFPHLSERAMLYVVFTFGEMIIAIAGYFEEEISLNAVYFSAMAFLIVVGLFLSYGTIYDHILDRNLNTTGISYMLLHIFLIFSLNNITTALEFMREETISLLPKTLFITGSILLYFLFLFLTGIFAKKRMRPGRRFIMRHAVLAGAFVMLMIVFREKMVVNIAVTVVYVFANYLMLHLYGRKLRA